MDGDEHMMNWFGIPYMGFIMLSVILIFLILAVIIYTDAEKRNMNGLLWFFLVLIPMVGVLSIILYLIIRENYPATATPAYSTPVVNTRMQHISSMENLKQLSKKDALAVLDERYAKGEISREEYLQMKLDLKIVT